MARFLVIALSLVLMGCGGGEKITDFSKRSVVYSWIDVSDIPGNKLVMYEMRNLSAAQSEKYYGMGYEKVGSGYLVWHNGFAPGRYELHRLQTMACAGPLCTNTINEYGFGPEGTSSIRTIVNGGDVQFAGCHAFKRTKRGFFRPGEFDTRKTACGASKRQMLSIMMKSVPAEHPIVAQRIRRAMK